MRVEEVLIFSTGACVLGDVSSRFQARDDALHAPPGQPGIPGDGIDAREAMAHPFSHRVGQVHQHHHFRR